MQTKLYKVSPTGATRRDSWILRRQKRPGSLSLAALKENWLLTLASERTAWNMLDNTLRIAKTLLLRSHPRGNHRWLVCVRRAHPRKSTCASGSSTCAIDICPLLEQHCVAFARCTSSFCTRSWKMRRKTRLIQSCIHRLMDIEGNNSPN